MSGSSGNILIVEDEVIARTRLNAILSRNSDYSIVLAESAAEAQRKLRTHHFDVVLLDIRLPDCDDFQLASFIGSRQDIGLIIISAINDTQSRLKGLQCGADDYLCKPYQSEELFLKVGKLIQRVSMVSDYEEKRLEKWQFGPWQYNPHSLELIRNNGEKVIKLSGQEKRLLSTFVDHPKCVFSRQQLLDVLHKDSDNEVFDRAIDSAIARLRKRIEINPKNPSILKTVYGEGYIFDTTVKRI